MKNVMKRAFISAAAATAVAITSTIATPAAFADDGATHTTPAPATERVCENVPGEFELTSGILKWGLRSSFTNYILKGPAQGKILPTDVTWDGSEFTFAATNGSFSAREHSGTFNYKGSIQFTGHGGDLDLTFSNLKLVAHGRSANFHVDIAGKTLKGTSFDNKDVVFATVDLSGHRHEGPKTIFDNAPVVLTQAGAEAFAGFYKAGDDLAPATGELVMAPKQVCTDKPVTPGPGDGTQSGSGSGMQSGHDDGMQSGSGNGMQSGHVVPGPGDGTQSGASTRSVAISGGDSIAGGTVTFVASGFQPGEMVTFEVHSTPIIAGRVAADSRGTATLVWKVPAGFEPGQHTVYAIGRDGLKTAGMPFTVKSASAPSVTPPPTVKTTDNTSKGAPQGKVTASKGTLAKTGASTMAAGIAALMLLGTGAALVRRRQS